MSLERILEPEVMDTIEEAIAYDKMDHSEVNQKFVQDFLAAGLPDTSQLEVLDLGTGTGLIPIELCRQHPTLRVLAVDLSAHMLDLAMNNVEVAGLRGRIYFDRIDAKQMTYQEARFSAVMSNSIIHHVPQPRSPLAEAVRLTAPGGLLFFRDLMRPQSKAELAALVETYAGGEEEHARQMFEDSLHAALTVEEMRALVEDLGFDSSTVQATSDRHWTFTAKKLAQRAG